MYCPTIPNSCTDERWIMAGGIDLAQKYAFVKGRAQSQMDFYIRESQCQREEANLMAMDLPHNHTPRTTKIEILTIARTCSFFYS